MQRRSFCETTGFVLNTAGAGISNRMLGETRDMQPICARHHLNYSVVAVYLVPRVQGPEMWESKLV